VAGCFWDWEQDSLGLFLFLEDLINFVLRRENEFQYLSSRDIGCIYSHVAYLYMLGNILSD
jgi:hypothetical protein